MRLMGQQVKAGKWGWQGHRMQGKWSWQGDSESRENVVAIETLNGIKKYGWQINTSKENELHGLILQRGKPCQKGDTERRQNEVDKGPLRGGKMRLKNRHWIGGKWSWQRDSKRLENVNKL